MTLHDDFLFRGDLATIDPDVAQLIDLEKERQARKLIMIPSESSSPQAVREAIGSVLMNIYAEGYPNPETRWLAEEEILDYEHHLAHYRRYGDQRYYRGAGQRRRPASVAKTGRHHYGYGATPRRSPDPRQSGEYIGAALQRHLLPRG